MYLKYFKLFMYRYTHPVTAQKYLQTVASLTQVPGKNVGLGRVFKCLCVSMYNRAPGRSDNNFLVFPLLSLGTG